MTAIAPFPYYGGKARFVDWISTHCPDANQFVDLFGGSGVVGLSMRERYRKIVYNDINSRLWGFFRILRERHSELIDLIDKTPASREEYGYCANRSEDPVEDARRVFVRVNQSFSNVGLYRKTSGSWMTQPGSTQSVARSFVRRSELLPMIAKSIRSWDIENLDWKDVVRRYDSTDTLFFADPPYDLSARTGGIGYANEMTEQDHRQLAATLSDAKAFAVVCGYRSDLYDTIYADWRREELEINCGNSAGKTGGKGNARRTECLWIKPTKGDAQCKSLQSSKFEQGRLKLT